MNIKTITPFKEALLQVVVETPRGVTFKYTYNEEQDVFELTKVLPLGFSFPYDFGFVPNTKAEDGDPVDVLVLLEAPATQGSLVACRVLGVLEASQKERDGKEMRNDRVVAVAERSLLYAHLKNIGDLDAVVKDQIATFFVTYNSEAGKIFTPLRWADAAAAKKLIEEKTVS